MKNKLECLKTFISSVVFIIASRIVSSRLELEFNLSPKLGSLLFLIFVMFAFFGFLWQEFLRMCYNLCRITGDKERKNFGK